MDKKQAIFNENDIPYKELELIGISKKQIWSLDKANITALLSGKRTSLLDLSFHDNNGEEISMKGKISLYWKDSNNAGVKVHPVRPETVRANTVRSTGSGESGCGSFFCHCSRHFVNCACLGHILSDRRKRFCFGPGGRKQTDSAELRRIQKDFRNRIWISDQNQRTGECWQLI